MSEKILALTASAPNKSWVSCLDYFQNKMHTYDKKDIAYILEKMELALSLRKVKQSENWLLLGLIVHPELFIEQIKKKGSLRPSKYNFESSELIQKIIKKVHSIMPISSDLSSYFESLILLHKIGIETRALQRKIILNLNLGKEKLLREILISTDFVFMLQATRGWSYQDKKVENSINSMSAETIADACGYIVFLFNTHIRKPEKLDLKTNISNICIETLLVNAVKIRSIFEFEVMIDAYNYRITINTKDNSILELEPPSTDFEKSLRLGYIQNEVQTALRHWASEHYKNDGLKKLAEKLYQDFGDKFITLKTEPLSRYVLRFPWESPLTEWVYNEQLYSDEAVILEYATQEWAIKLDNLLNFEASDGVVMWDVLRAQRVINLFRWILVSHLEPRLDTEYNTVAQSLLPVFSLDKLKSLLDGAIGKDSQKLIDFLSYNFSGNGMFDLQYQPIIRLKDEYAIPYNIMANSNILRNSLQLSRRRFYENGKDDPLSLLMHKALSSKTSKVAMNVSYKWNGREGEVDNIALINGFLFVFECKNSSLPCNPHEARTSYDYISKASIQLDRFKDFYTEQSFRKYLAAKLGWNADDINNATLVTGIIMSNRMFIGYRIRGHAVRGSLETINHINTGIIEIGEEQKCLWNGDKFIGSDLYDFMDNDVIHKQLLSAMRPTDIEYFFIKHKLVQKSYALDMEIVAKNFGFEKSAAIIAKQKDQAQSTEA